jgi:gas vesicle protein
VANDSGSNGFLMFVAGIAAGVTVAMLVAPQAGVDTRKTLAEKTQKGRTALAQSGKGVLDQSRDMLERGRKLAEQAAEMFERGRQLIETTAAHLESDTSQA